MDEQSKAVLKRFLRVFVSGAVGNMAAIAVVSHTFTTLADLGTWLLALAAAGFAGGIAALDKALRWQE